MNRLLLTFSVAVCALGNTAYAQDPQDKLLPDIQPPTPPLVARAPDPSAWIITIKPKTTGPLDPSPSSGHPPKYLKQQSWVKSGDKIRCTNLWTDGTKTVDWVAGSVKLVQNTLTNGVILLNPASQPTVHDFTQGDFERIDWLTMKDYVGAVEYQKEPYYLFRAKNLMTKIDGKSPQRGMTAEDLHAPTSPTTVLINVKTHLPAVIANDDGIFQFQFQPAPPGDLQIAEPFASFWKAFGQKR